MKKSSVTINNTLGMRQEKRKVGSMVCATGSFGRYHGPNGGLQTVWFCGRTRGELGEQEEHGRIVRDDPCTHATREDARTCQQTRRIVTE